MRVKHTLHTLQEHVNGKLMVKFRLVIYAYQESDKGFHSDIQKWVTNAELPGLRFIMSSDIRCAYQSFLVGRNHTA